MADGVLITPGSGVTVATDDTGGTGQVQLFKLAISTNGSPTLVPADSTYGLANDIIRMPAADVSTDNVGAAAMTDVMMNDRTSLTPKFKVIDNATSGDNTIVAAVTSRKIRVLACFLVTAAAVNVRFESSAGGTALTGQMNVAANGGFVLPFNPVGWFETLSGALLNMELSGATSCDGCLVYVEV